jgi:hypothetical protein
MADKGNRAKSDVSAAAFARSQTPYSSGRTQLRRRPLAARPMNRPYEALTPVRERWMPPGAMRPTPPRRKARGWRAWRRALGERFPASQGPRLRKHWGHSSNVVAVELAQAAQVKRLREVHQVIGFVGNGDSHASVSEPFSLALPVLVKDDGTREYFVRVSYLVPLEFGHSVKLPGFTDEIVDVIWVPPSSALGSTFDHKRAYERLAADPGAAAVIKSFIASPRDWCEIYKVVELIEKRLIEKRCRGIPENWVSEPKLKALKGTACSWAEAGRTGRHANPRFRGPPKPMSIDEGEQTARHIVGEWLQSPDV